MRDLGFEYETRKSGEIVIRRGGTVVATLRRSAAHKFISDIARRDPQLVMAKVTGNYKRGNETRSSGESP